MSSAAETMKDDDKIPFSVRQYLSTQAVEYRLLSRREARGLSPVECVLLADDMGKVQVFLPSNRLLDLQAIRQLTGRNLAAAPLFERERHMRKLSLDELPALDGLNNLETLIDYSVPAEGPVCIQSGVRGVFLELPRAADIQRKDQTRRLNISAELPDRELDYDLSLFELDRDAIEDSVNRFTAKRIRQRLEETLEIPPLPATAKEIIRLRVDPNADINKLSALVEKDPSLAAQVISWASSSYYAAPGSVRSVQDAIVRVLGYDLVMNLSLGLALGRSLQMPNDAPEGYSSYWQEAVYTAATVGELYNRIPREFRPSFGLSYLGGLLHNFGYLVLAHVFKPHFSTCCRLWEANPHLEPQRIEDHVLGINRDQIAASLLESWKIPGEVCMAIRYSSHHQYYGEYADYASLVGLAVSMARRGGLIGGPRIPVDPTVFSRLHIEPRDAQEAVAAVLQARDELNALASGLEQ